MMPDFIELVEAVLKKAEYYQEGKRYHIADGDYEAGTDDGYTSALEDLLIHLKKGNKNEMSRPECFFNA